MVNHIFIVKVVVSFVVAGVWIAGSTMLAEKLGSRIGGLITNLPSNILISLIFIALVNDLSFVINAIPGIPVGMAINTIFLLVFILTVKQGLLYAVIVSLFSWLLLAILVVKIPLHNLIFNMIAYSIIVVLSYVFLDKFSSISSVHKSTKTYTKSQITVRAVFAGGIVAAVIIISRIFNPYIVGIFATFPAVLLSTMVILVINQNAQFARATGKILILSSTNIVVYAVLVYFTYPALGLVIGTIISFLGAFGWVWMFWPVINRDGK